MSHDCAVLEFVIRKKTEICKWSDSLVKPLRERTLVEWGRDDINPIVRDRSVPIYGILYEMCP